MVNAGGDVRSRHPGAVIRLLDPWEHCVATVPLGAAGLATSSRTRRRWHAAGEDAHHLIDPRTGAPADSPIFSATAMAPTAVEAEAGAKAVLIEGRAGLAWADTRTWLSGALAIWADGAVYATTGLKLEERIA